MRGPLEAQLFGCKTSIVVAIAKAVHMPVKRNVANPNKIVCAACESVHSPERPQKGVLFTNAKGSWHEKRIHSPKYACERVNMDNTKSPRRIYEPLPRQNIPSSIVTPIQYRTGPQYASIAFAKARRTTQQLSMPTDDEDPSSNRLEKSTHLKRIVRTIQL